MRVLVDLMGGDRSPVAQAEGARIALAQDPQLNIGLLGQSSALVVARSTLGEDPRVTYTETTEVIGNDDQPALAVRRMKDSSMVVGLQLVKHGQADAFLSCGPTGALLAGALFAFGRLPGVRRPALGSVFPNMAQPGKTWFMLDIGANVDASAQDLLAYGVLGAVYSSLVLGVQEPRVALLNIGTETHKGTEVVRAAHDLLRDSTLNFVGNVESRDILGGPADVVVCDAFVGNILLKGLEGLLAHLGDGISRELKSDTRSAVGGILARPALRRAMRVMDYTEYGGAPLFGLNGACIKCHGSSNETAVANGIRVAAQFAGKDVLVAMAAALAAQPSTASTTREG